MQGSLCRVDSISSAAALHSEVQVAGPCLGQIGRGIETIVLSAWEQLRQGWPLIAFWEASVEAWGTVLQFCNG